MFYSEKLECLSTKPTNGSDQVALGKLEVMNDRCKPLLLICYRDTIEVTRITTIAAGTMILISHSQS
jgi:hypothetical protein